MCSWCYCWISSWLKRIWLYMKEILPRRSNLLFIALMPWIRTCVFLFLCVLQWMQGCGAPLSQVLGWDSVLTSNWGLWAMPNFHSASSRSPKKMAQRGAVHFVTTSFDHELLSCAKSPVWLLQKRGLQPPSCFLPIPSCSQGKCSPRFAWPV